MFLYIFWKRRDENNKLQHPIMKSSNENPPLSKGRGGGVLGKFFFRTSPHPSLVRRGINSTIHCLREENDTSGQ
jgi:hypothetical protein